MCLVCETRVETCYLGKYGSRSSAVEMCDNFLSAEPQLKREKHLQVPIRLSLPCIFRHLFRRHIVNSTVLRNTLFGIEAMSIPAAKAHIGRPVKHYRWVHSA